MAAEGGDYRWQERFRIRPDGYKLQFVNDAEKGDFFDLKLLLTEDFQFSSEPEFGLEAVDIVTNTIRRSLSGHFNRAGWLAIPQLMIHRASHCIKLISLSREDQFSELLSRVVFASLNQAAIWSSSITSIPSLNLIPVTTFAR